jgi:DNA-binding transcriptional ArsR family regulator
VAGNGNRDELPEKRVDEQPLERLLTAVSHPLRRQMMRVLAYERGSAKSLSEQFDVPLPTASYHLNRVLAEACEVVELVDAIRRRGSQEKIYVLDRAAIAAGVALIRCRAFPFPFPFSFPSDPPGEPG